MVRACRQRVIRANEWKQIKHRNEIQKWDTHIEDVQ